MARTQVQKSVEPRARVRGEVVTRALSAVKPNGWNPNRMTPFIRDSLKRGLVTDGWIASQALLVWGVDDKGVRRDLIIDGEHRWTIARELGMETGPMVFLDGLTEAQAKALTVKMNGKRGEFDGDDLGKLLREIAPVVGGDSFALDLGITDGALTKLLAGESGAAPPTPQLPTGTKEQRIALVFAPEKYEEFNRLSRELAERFATANVSDTVLEALRRLAKK